LPKLKPASKCSVAWHRRAASRRPRPADDRSGTPDRSPASHVRCRSR